MSLGLVVLEAEIGIIGLVIVGFLFGVFVLFLEFSIKFKLKI